MSFPFVFIHQDYYSIPFPTPTTPLTGRDGSLSSNPYSGREKDCSDSHPIRICAASTSVLCLCPLELHLHLHCASCTAFGLEHASHG